MNTGTKKVYQCCFCDKILSSRQGLSRHKSTTKKCKDLQNESLIVKQSIQPAPTPLGLQSIELVSSPLPANSPANSLPSADEILRLRQELAETQEVLLKYKALHDKHLKDEIERPTEPVNHYNLDNHDTELEKFDSDNYEHMNQFYEYVMSRFTPDKFKLGQLGMTVVYSFFFPRFWRCTDKKRHVFKYISDTGKPVVDHNLQRLVKLITPAFCEIGGSVRDQLLEKEFDFDLKEKYNKIYYEDIASNSKPFFVEQMKRIVDLQDGKEIRKTMEEATHAFRPC